MATECFPPGCAAHDYVVSALDRFESLAGKLTEGQQQIQLNVVKLTEQIENTKRLHDRVDKLESFMWKIMGGGVVLAAIIPIVLKLLFGI